MAVRYRSVAVGALPAGPATTTIYTVPTDRTLILKRWRVWISAGAGNLQYIVFRAGVGNVVVGQFNPTAANTVYDVDVEALCAQEGDQLRMFNAATVAGLYIVSGSLLQGDPS